MCREGETHKLGVMKLKEHIKISSICTKANMTEGKMNHTQDYGSSMVDSAPTSGLLIPGLACLFTKRRYRLCIKQVCLWTDTYATILLFS